MRVVKKVLFIVLCLGVLANSCLASGMAENGKGYLSTISSSEVSSNASFITVPDNGYLSLKSDVDYYLSIPAGYDLVPTTADATSKPISAMSQEDTELYFFKTQSISVITGGATGTIWLESYSRNR